MELNPCSFEFNLVYFHIYNVGDQQKKLQNESAITNNSKQFVPLILMLSEIELDLRPNIYH